MRHRSFRVSVWTPFLLGALLAVNATGCGPGNVATVTGNVSYQGERLPFGTIAFESASGWAASSNIRQGSYEIQDVPAGEVKVTVQTFAPPPQVVPPGTPSSEVKDPNLRQVILPAEYGNFATTPVRLTIAPGKQTHNIDLK